MSDGKAAGSAVNLIGNRGGSTAYSASWDVASLTVNAVNDAPVLSGISGTIGYSLAAPPLVIAPTANVSDIDSSNFAGGQLRVRITEGADAADLLALSGDFYVDENNQVFQGSTLIGTRTSDGSGGNQLVISFQANTTPAIAQQLLRSITFATSGPAAALSSSVAVASDRKILFSLLDDNGDWSAELCKTVQVE